LFTATHVNLKPTVTKHEAKTLVELGASPYLLVKRKKTLTLIVFA
jgi:hypothetical protein